MTDSKPLTEKEKAAQNEVFRKTYEQAKASKHPLDNEERHLVFSAISLLSDSQELHDMGHRQDANLRVNAAKYILAKVYESLNK